MAMNMEGCVDAGFRREDIFYGEIIFHCGVVLLVGVGSDLADGKGD